MDDKDVKLCVKCEKVKPLQGGFYRAGTSWQKYCKICHNERRATYPKSIRTYTPKPTGFKRLPDELQKKIIYDVYVKINYKNITRKYEKEYNIKHQTLLKWAKSGQIPKYEPSEF